MFKFTLEEYQKIMKLYEDSFTKMYMNNNTSGKLKNSEYYDHDNETFGGFKIRVSNIIENDMIIILNNDFQYKINV